MALDHRGGRTIRAERDDEHGPRDEWRAVVAATALRTMKNRTARR
jgi:hypothetical protein